MAKREEKTNLIIRKIDCDKFISWGLITQTHIHTPQQQVRQPQCTFLSHFGSIHCDLSLPTKKNSEFTFNVPRFLVNKTLSLSFNVQINLFAIKKTPTPLTNLKIEEKTLSHTIRLKKEGIAGIPSGIKNTNYVRLLKHCKITAKQT